MATEPQINIGQIVGKDHKKKSFMSHISANDLKTKSIYAIEAALSECELKAALAETHADLVVGRFVQESAQDHLARLDTL